MRPLSYLTTILLAFLLASCGGGGGSPGVGSGSVQSFLVAAPTAFTLQVGLTQQYTIQGGVKPYTVFSNNPAVAVGWLIGENVVAVGTAEAGSAVVTVQDAKGAKFDMAVTAGATTAFFSTAPTSLSLAPGALGSQTYKLRGGTKPYKAVSSFPRAVSVEINGDDVTITALQVAGTPGAVQSAVVTMTDSSSPPAVWTTSVSLTSIPLFVTPTSLTGFVGDVFRAVVTGGTPPYRALVNIDESLLSAKIVNGNQLEVVGGQVVTAAGVQILDANNVSVSVSFTLSAAGQDVLRIQPTTLSFPESATTPNITIQAYGASATGGIQVFSSNPAFLAPQTPVRNADGSGWAITLTGGNTCSATIQLAIAGVDNTVPADGDFTDPVGPGNATADVAPVPAAGGNRVVTITVIDAKGKSGTSTITITDANGKPGC
jgi:hypothetical protein